MEATFDTAQSGSTPELTPLGKCIEHLRIQRGLSKQLLARHAGTSRQQLWRIMTGKSDLTVPLRHRLAEVLGVDPRSLQEVDASRMSRLFPFGGSIDGPVRLAFDAYLEDPAALRATLRSLPVDEVGRQLKRDLLDAIEERAHARGHRLPPSFFAVRGEVINGDL